MQNCQPRKALTQQKRRREQRASYLVTSSLQRLTTALNYMAQTINTPSPLDLLRSLILKWAETNDTSSTSDMEKVFRRWVETRGEMVITEPTVPTLAPKTFERRLDVEMPNQRKKRKGLIIVVHRQQSIYPFSYPSILDSISPL